MRMMITAGLQSLGKCVSDRRRRDEDPFEAGKSSAIKEDTRFGRARVLWTLACVFCVAPLDA